MYGTCLPVFEEFEQEKESTSSEEEGEVLEVAQKKLELAELFKIRVLNNNVSLTMFHYPSLLLFSSCFEFLLS